MRIHKPDTSPVYYQLPPRPAITPERVAPLMVALGPGWKACAEVLPWEDINGQLRYVVYSPPYCGALLLCRFQLFSPARWWEAGLQVGISGVTHWRLAADDEPEFAELDSPPTAAPMDVQALAQLRRWWSWYSAYKGLKAE